MSDVKRYSIVTDSLDIREQYVLASDYDAMAKRCLELDEDLAEQAALLEEASGQRDFLDKQQSDEYFRREKAEVERDTLRAEVERLQAKLRRIEYVAACGSVQSWLALPDDAKAQWFAMHLEMDEERLNLRKDRDQIERIARYLVRAYIVDDQAYDPNAAADKAMTRLLEQHK